MSDYIARMPLHSHSLTVNRIKRWKMEKISKYPTKSATFYGVLNSSIVIVSILPFTTHLQLFIVAPQAQLLFIST